MGLRVARFEYTSIFLSSDSDEQVCEVIHTAAVDRLWPCFYFHPFFFFFSFMETLCESLAVVKNMLLEFKQIECPSLYQNLGSIKGPVRDLTAQSANATSEQ